MNALTRHLIVLPVLGLGSALGAPSLQLANEWSAPLETRRALVIVNSDTGQYRVLDFNGSMEATETGPAYTYLPEVTGLSTGFDIAGGEKLLLSSEDTNAIRVISPYSNDQSSFQPNTPGPISAVPARFSAGDPPGIFVTSRFGTTSNPFSRFIDILGTPTVGGGAIEFPLNDLQPFLTPGSGARHALISLELGSNTNLYEAEATATGTTYTYLGNSGVTGEKIASECYGDDGRVCAIRYQKGNTRTSIVTLPHSGFTLATEFPTALPFRIGGIISVGTNIPNAPHGVLITSEDGTTAVYAHILSGKEYKIIETFSPNIADGITGLMPVPGRGFVALQEYEGSGITGAWDAYQNSGTGWNNVQARKLGAWLPAQQNFATMFWFNGTPLVDPTAEIIGLETRADWTEKESAAPIPAQVRLSELGSELAGLEPTSTEASNAPAGATFLITSQHEDTVSISALASNEALLAPSLSISPASGNYTSSVTVAALFDAGANDLYVRENTPGSSWQLFDTLTVGYPSTWHFYAKNKSTDTNAPIVSRTYSFPGVDLNQIDTDGDTIPDYVERHLGLDPAGGSDSDGDFQSDLEEILESNDPADHTSNTPPSGTRTPPFLGEGFELIAQAYNGNNQGASPANEHSGATTEDDFPGETLHCISMFGQLLAQENVAELTAPPALAGQDGAFITVGTPVFEHEWIVLKSPKNFGVLDVINPSRTGREVYKVMARPSNPVASIVTSPSGTDRSADATAWISAAQTAHAAHITVSSITELRPADNAVAALAEQAIFNSLQALPSQTQIDLGVPATIAEFTLFPCRIGETTLTPFSREMFDALISTGCDFPAMITALQAAASDGAIQSLATTITNLHALDSGVNPFMAYPLDAFRSIIRTGTIVDPAPGEPARVNPYITVSPSSITSAQSYFNGLLSTAAGTKRPVETWNVYIDSATTPGHDYDYRRQSNNNLTWLTDSLGDRIQLEQGLGLPLGAIFAIEGYTDVTGPAGFDTLEFIRVISATIPVATDNDTNANFLDDGWEQVFFGTLGAVDPFDTHPDTGHTYLQYHLEGADPRAGDLAVPVVEVMPKVMGYTPVPAASSVDVDFDFPADYFSQFDFTLVSSTDMTGFSGPANNGAPTMVSPGRYRFRILASEANLDANFFKIGMSVATPTP